MLEWCKWDARAFSRPARQVAIRIQYEFVWKQYVGRRRARLLQRTKRDAADDVDGT